MSLPIPEPSGRIETPAASIKIKGPRPAGLGVLISAQVVIQLVEILGGQSWGHGQSPSAISAQAYLALLGLSLLILLLLSYLLWQGSASARIVILWLSALLVVNAVHNIALYLLSDNLMTWPVSDYVALSRGFDAVLALCWLRFLTRPASKDFFLGRPAAS